MALIDVRYHLIGTVVYCTGIDCLLGGDVLHRDSIHQADWLQCHTTISQFGNIGTVGDAMVLFMKTGIH